MAQKNQYTEEELIQEAEKRGYRYGTLVDYGGQLEGTDTLGSGEFEFINDHRGCKLIKYEADLKSDKTPRSRRFDTIWDLYEGWVKIADKAHGFSL